MTNFKKTDTIIPKHLFLFFFSGNFSTITVKYFFKRRMGYYLIQVYFPDFCVVALSWIVFWMDKNDMGNRMALGITTILTIMFLLGSLNGTMPRVSYPKALDWYLLVSFAFAFLSLVECMIVFVVWLSSNKRKAKKVRVCLNFYLQTGAHHLELPSAIFLCNGVFTSKVIFR